MSHDPARTIPRWAGAAFVAQFATSLAAGVLLASVLTGDTAESVRNAISHPAALRASIVLELATGVGIIALTCMLYLALRRASRPVALVAFACWLAEAAVLAVSVVGSLALLDLTGSRPPESVEVQAAQLALGLREHAAAVALLFFGVGAVLWYALMIRTRFVPLWLSVWALVGASLILIATVLVLCGVTAPIALYVLYVPVELVLGLWLVVRGSAYAPELAVTEPPTPIDVRD